MINCEKIMGDYEKCCKARISALMSRVCHMEMMLEKVLGQMDVEAKQQQLYFPCADSSCVPHLQRKTVFLEQPGSTPSLHEAARLQNTVALARSLSRGADPNALDVRGDTALHCAARSGDALAAELLLACGATLDVCGVGGTSPLSVAIREGHTNVVQVLLEKGANIEHQDDIGLSPLITALFSENLEMVNLLAKKAAILGVVESPLITASRFCRTDNLKVLIDILQPSKEQILEAISVAFSPNVAVILLEKTSKEIICSTNFSADEYFATADAPSPPPQHAHAHPPAPLFDLSACSNKKDGGGRYCGCLPSAAKELVSGRKKAAAAVGVRAQGTGAKASSPSSAAAGATSAAATVAPRAPKYRAAPPSRLLRLRQRHPRSLRQRHPRSDSARAAVRRV